MDPPGRTRDRDRAITCTYVPGTSRYARSEAPGRSQPASGKTKRETWTSRTDLITDPAHRTATGATGPARGGRRARRGTRPFARVSVSFLPCFLAFCFSTRGISSGTGVRTPRPQRATRLAGYPLANSTCCACRRRHAGVPRSASPLGTRGPRAAASPASHRPCFTSYTYRY